MNSLIAKINNEYKLVVRSKDAIIDNLTPAEIQEACVFTPNYKLEDKEWFKLPDFSKQDYFIGAYRSKYNDLSLNQINNNDYEQIDCIVIFQNDQKHFQRITSSRFIDHKTWIDFSGSPEIVEQRKQLEIKPKSDAVYINDKDTLYFKDIAKIKVLFPGIEILHREATQEEVNEFLSHDFIKLDNYKMDDVGVQNRKRIADIGAKYRNLEENKKNRLIEYAKEKAGIDLTDEKAFQISSETDLKKLLYAIDQRYYYADIYGENRVANSVRVISKKTTSS